MKADSVLLQLSSCLQKEAVLIMLGCSAPHTSAPLPSSPCSARPHVPGHTLSSENTQHCHSPLAAWVETLLTAVSHIICPQSHLCRPQLHRAQSQGLLRAREWASQGQLGTGESGPLNGCWRVVCRLDLSCSSPWEREGDDHLFSALPSPVCTDRQSVDSGLACSGPPEQG